MGTDDSRGAAWLDDSAMSIRSLFVSGALILFASVVFGGSYQRTRDGQTLVWRDVPSRGDEATWSGKRDENGFATGSGVLTWYKSAPTIVTGSNILDTRRYAVVINHYSGTMVHGKFKGAVSYLEGMGKTWHETPVKRADRASRHQKATQKRTAEVRANSTPDQTSTPSSQPIVVDTPERTSALETSTAAPEQNLSPGTKEPETAATSETAPEQRPPPGAEESQPAAPSNTSAVAADNMVAAAQTSPKQRASPGAAELQSKMSAETGTLMAKQITTVPSDQQTRQPGAQTTTATKPTPSHVLVRSLSKPPMELPKPAPDIDEQTVAGLDTLYQSAVKANDAAIMDEILADDFVLVTDHGASLTKNDLIKEAQGKRTIYEDHEVEKGTQKVRIWRDTAVVTGLLKVKGTRDQNSFGYNVWMSETFVRTPTGWRYVFGQASKSNAE